MAQQRGTSIVTMLIFFAIFFAIGFVGGFISAANYTLGMLILYAGIIFIGYPLMVNIEGIYIKIFNREHANSSELFSNFSVNYLRKVGGMLWMSLFVFLWTLLLVIPGIIKSLAYCMTPLILADCPEVTARDALKLSIRMTKGHKMDLFILGLSFIGWLILSMLTLGILYIVYVGPYVYTTYAGYYVELRDKAIANGTIDRAELYGRQQ